ncbi:hypothetical protein AOC36_01145 [Erysipelothrix larvae]|uniref:Uncharacterized protein n=1 Tax=Erysipelothrix larvae TaxID=1514105 RepID=A0A0X8GYA8_9FIRM|nr:hypothetical protein [Erysipelothrix larvae]AMC92648.1 hypothetical protein AOC36_01145 [Erysipelothrix larvae]
MSKKVNTKSTTKKKSKGKKKDWSYYVLIVSAVIIAIPVLFLGYVALTATRGSGAPVSGNRFENDLNPAIQQSEINTIVSNITALDGVDAAFAELKTATLRIYVLAPDASEETLKTTATNAYAKVTETLDPEVYFTIQDTKKQYDLEIHVYNQKEVTEESKPDYIYVLYWKSSNMEEPSAQVLTTPLSQEIVDYFRQIDDEANQDSESNNAETNSGESGE